MKIRYFAWVRERVGKAEEEIEPPATIATVSDLVSWLSARGDEYAYAFENPKIVRAAIDHAHVRADADVLALTGPLFDGLYEYRRRALALGREPS